MNTNLKIAVTGATGYIGSNLVSYLCKKGYSVFPIVRPNKANSSAENLAGYRIGDVTDVKSLENAFKGVDVVFHLAALFNHPELTWKDYKNVNIKGTKNVLSAALKCNVKKVIHCSTVGVATNSGNMPYDENTPYSPPKWDKYEITKCKSEKLAIDFSQKNNLDTVIVRPAQVYGPGDIRKSKIYKMVQKGYIINPGNTIKHTIYIDELCRAFELAMVTKTNIGDVFIIADQNGILLKDFIQIIANKLGTDTPKFKIPSKPVTLISTATEKICNALKIKPPLFRRSMDFFTKSVLFNVKKASDKLNFRSNVDISSGVEKTIKWYKTKGLLYLLIFCESINFP